MTTPHELIGIGVSPGVAYGPAVIVRLDVPDVPNRFIDDHEVEGELRRLDEAANRVVETLTALKERVRERAGAEESHIFDAQILIRDVTVELAVSVCPLYYLKMAGLAE